MFIYNCPYLKQKKPKFTTWLLVMSFPPQQIKWSNHDHEVQKYNLVLENELICKELSTDIHSATWTGWFNRTCPFKFVWDRYTQFSMNRMNQQEMEKLTLPCPFMSVWEIPVVSEQLRMLLIALLINTMQGTNSKTPRWVFTYKIE